MKVLLSGNEAIARGPYEYGIALKVIDILAEPEMRQGKVRRFDQPPIRERK